MKFPILILVFSLMINFSCSSECKKYRKDCVLCVLDKRCLFVQKMNNFFECVSKWDSDPVRKLFRRPGRCIYANQLMEQTEVPPTSVSYSRETPSSAFTPSMTTETVFWGTKPTLTTPITVYSTMVRKTEINLPKSTTKVPTSFLTTKSPLYSSTVNPKQEYITTATITTSPRTTVNPQTTEVIDWSESTPVIQKSELSMNLTASTNEIDATSVFCTSCEKICNASVNSILLRQSKQKATKSSCVLGNYDEVRRTPLMEKKLIREIKRTACRQAHLFRVLGDDSLLGQRWSEYNRKNPYLKNTKRCNKFKNLRL